MLKRLRLKLKGILFFLSLFVISNLLNSDFSYMGNSSSDLTSTIIKVFWPVILIQLIKVLLIYIALGYIFDTIYSSSIDYLNSKTGKNVSGGYVYLLLSVSFISLFLRSIINNPQLFIDNFSSKFVILDKFHILMTDHFSPWFFALIFYIINIPAVILFLLSLWEKYKSNIKVLQFIANAKSFNYKNRKVLVSAALIVVVIAVSAIYTNSKPAPGKKNILIISSDSIRPDRISANGYFRKTTPNIDRYIEKNLQFRGVTTTVPRTFPAWVSILASSTPLANEITHMFPRSRERSEKLPSAVAYLKDSGYYTSIISEFAGDIFSRIDLGFDHKLVPDMNFNVIIKQVILEKQVFLLPYLLNSTGRTVFPEIRDIAKFSDPVMLTDETIGQIKNAGDKPFFISVFYSITHFPFAASYPYYQKYAQKDYSGPYKYYKQIKIKLGNDTQNKEGDGLTAADREQVQALYDGCLSQLDNEAGRILSYLEKNNLLKNTIVIITSDHGENLYEYDYGIGHGEHLRGDFALEVPFIIIADNLSSGQRGAVITKRSSIADIMPTVFELAGITIPDFFNGSSLFGNKKREVDAYCETGIWFDNNKDSPLFFYHNRIDYPDISGLLEVDFNYKREGVIKQDYQNIITGAKYRTIYSGGYKLIYMPLKEGVKFELYDVKTDKDNRNNLADKKPEVLKDMKAKFYNYIYKESSGNLVKTGDYVLPLFSYPLF
ncbi:MAG TPA: sulfatase-like hydrolase/transferase [Spirochaetota bacterium]|nr:sulfatase-like hydrolase/transferase [Spirochaetota bacterium]